MRHAHRDHPTFRVHNVFLRQATARFAWDRAHIESSYGTVNSVILFVSYCVMNLSWVVCPRKGLSVSRTYVYIQYILVLYFNRIEGSYFTLTSIVYLLLTIRLITQTHICGVWWRRPISAHTAEPISAPVRAAFWQSPDSLAFVLLHCTNCDVYWPERQYFAINTLCESEQEMILI